MIIEGEKTVSKLKRKTTEKRKAIQVRSRESEDDPTGHVMSSVQS